MIEQKRPGYFGADQINDGLRDFFAENGFAVVTGALLEGELDELVTESVAICRGKRGSFSGGWGDVPAVDDESQLSDEEVQKRFLCIHQPHKGSDVMKRYLAQQAIKEVLTRVIGPNVKCMQSMLFIKSAGKPGQAWHQDEDFIPTRDRSLTGAWIALDDATVENGCLWVIPSSHKPGILWPQYPHDDKRFDCAHESYNFPYTDDDAVPVEVPRGSIVFFNGYLLHRSLPNRASTGFRRVLVNHYMSAESFLPWRVSADTPVAQADYRDIVMIAGKDPYHWKGTEDIAQPHVRPDGMGGCGDGRMSLDEYKKNEKKASS